MVSVPGTPVEKYWHFTNDSNLLDRTVPRFARAVVLASVTLISCVCASAQVNVTTYQNDIGRTGQNLNETILTPANVNATQFGKLFSQPVDGQVYAQPLYLSGLTVNGATHNVIFVATENDSVYAFDADSNGGANSTPLWHDSMLSSAFGAAAGATTVSSNEVGSDIQPQIGITGTPVIDPVSGTLYVVSKAIENGNAVQRLHALSVTTGLEKFGGPVVITASVAGAGNGSVNGTLTFDSLWENQRPGLLLLNGIVYIGFAAHGDNGPWHGWILGYNAGTLTQTGAYCSTPNGTGGGFWMSGQGLAADQLNPSTLPFGRMFVPTGNGDYNATKPYTSSMDYGDSHLDLDLTNGVPNITDEFTTNQQANLDSQDGDVGSGGMMVIPTQTTGSNPHLAVQAGKAGTLFLLNRDNLGGYNTTTDQVVQELPYSVGYVGVWSSPAYWNGNIYYWGRFDYLKEFALTNGLLNTTPIESVETIGFPGATPSISASGTTNGIVWTVDSEAYSTPGPAILMAHNATNVATTLYSSATNATRDAAGNAVKFVVPTVVNGKVYVGAASEVDIYGLFAATVQANAPTFTPGTEAFEGSLSVTIADSTPNATIYYTTNGSTATTASTLYTGPITVTSTETINAIATASGTVNSPQSSATFTDTTQAAAVTFSIPTGTYTTVQSVTLSDTTPNASIYYTTNGTTPTASSTLYTAAIAVNSTETITAIAIAPGVTNSPVLAQTYTITPGATGIDFTSGFASSAGLMILNGYTQLNDSRLQLTDGMAGEAGSAWYVYPVNIQNFTNDFTFQLSNPVANGITFTIQNNGTNALGGNGSALGYAPISNSVAIKFDFYTPVGNGKDSTGLYVNGATPTTPAIDLSATGINLNSDDDMSVHMVYNGTTLTMTITDMVTSATWTNSWTINIPSTIGANTAYVGFTGSTGAYTSSQKILTWSFASSVNSSAAATPTFSPAAGTYTSAQTVAISDATAGTTIYYTTNGSTPTTSSSVYSGAITVSASETLEAIAVASGYSNSAVASAAYTINASTQTAAPTFNVPGGTYNAAQTVTITDTTPGAIIYYTLNGSTPTTSSSLYRYPVSIGNSFTLNAIAVAKGDTASSVTSATYTLAAVAPVLTPAGGTYGGPQTVTITSASPSVKIYYTTSGNAPTTSSAVYSAPITVATSGKIYTFAGATGYTASPTVMAVYTITGVTPTPAFSPAAGSYSTSQTVTISDSFSGATIYYTTNGSTPTTASTVYTGPITVSATETVNAIAVVTGTSGTTSTSAVGSAAYTLVGVATPTFSVAAGTYTSAQTVTIGDTTSGATIYYTTNGTTPTTSSAVYSGAITVGVSETLKAIAVASGYSNSAVASAAYTIATPAATPIFSVGSGTYTSAQTVAISDATAGTTIYYTTNGSTPTTSSSVYSGAITVSASETLEAIAVASGYSNSAVASAAYTINASTQTAAPTFSVPGGTYNAAQTVTITDTTPGAIIYYTLNGSTPTTSSSLYRYPVSIGNSFTLNAIAVAKGDTASSVTSATYTLAAVAPVLTPAGGTYGGPQTVTITSASPSVKIYYTTSGNAPTTSSAVYSAPITVATSGKIYTFAGATGYTASPTVMAVYTITGVTPTPAFSPAAGSYSTSQTVTISDSFSGATIYYTTNGSTPTTASTVYTGPITVSATETVNAIAVVTGTSGTTSTSTVGSAAYTVN